MAKLSAPITSETSRPVCAAARAETPYLPVKKKKKKKKKKSVNFFFFRLRVENCQRTDKVVANLELARGGLKAGLARSERIHLKNRKKKKKKKKKR
jgi:hypothetical protein